MNTQQKPAVPPKLLNKWQHIVDLLAQLTGTPAVLVSQVTAEDIRLLLCSQNEGNPFECRGYVRRCRDMYCDHVVESQQALLVEDASKTEGWQNAPACERGMTFYLGLPLSWPDLEPFGTLCIMDQQTDNDAQKYQALMAEFQALINHDLMLLMQLETHHQRQLALEATLQQRDDDIAAHVTDLEETSTALRVLLRQREYDRKEMQAETSEELYRLITPYLDELEQGPLNAAQLNCLGQLRHQLTLNSDSQPISTALLSPMEQKIVRLIQQDRSSKEIADLLHLAKSTVDFHRRNIRRKLGLKSASVSLKSYLMSLV